MCVTQTNVATLLHTFNSFPIIFICRRSLNDVFNPTLITKSVPTFWWVRGIFIKFLVANQALSSLLRFYLNHFFCFGVFDHQGHGLYSNLVLKFILWVEPLRLHFFFVPIKISCDCNHIVLTKVKYLNPILNVHFNHIPDFRSLHYFYPVVLLVYNLLRQTLVFHFSIAPVFLIVFHL